MLVDCIYLGLKLFLILFFADMLTGLVHWAEDTYGDPNWKFMGIGKHVVWPNLIHHKYPREMIKGTWLDRVWTSVVFIVILTAIVWAFGGLTIEVAAVFWIAVWGNEFHCWTHRSPQENGKFITFLQKIYILQAPKQHAKHHFSPYDTNFCVMFSFVNPILQFLRFWKILEGTLSLIGLKPARGKEFRKVEDKFY